MGPFELHLREAIALNRSRTAHYAALSGGASRPISRALVGAELLLLPLARWYDRRAARYARAGVPLLGEIFVPMTRVPALERPDRAPPPSGRHGGAVRASAIRARVRAAMRRGSFDAAAAALDLELARLGPGSGTDCLARHLLESARRVAQVAPSSLAAARARGLPSPAPMLRSLLRLHLLGLGAASMLDRRARPLQVRGIPILERDLPPIPPWRPAR